MTTPRTKLKVGNEVFHRTHGKGVVKNGWKSWRACTHCYAPANSGCKCIEEFTGRKAPCMAISGLGTFDVLFNGDKYPRSINQDWLTKVGEFSVNPEPRASGLREELIATFCASRHQIDLNN